MLKVFLTYGVMLVAIILYTKFVVLAQPKEEKQTGDLADLNAMASKNHEEREDIKKEAQKAEKTLQEIKSKTN